MPFLYVNCIGGGDIGGFFSIDGENEVVATNGLVCTLSSGLHNIVYNKKSFNKSRPSESEQVLLPQENNDFSFDCNHSDDDFFVSLSFCLNDYDFITLTCYSDYTNTVYDAPVIKMVKAASALEYNSLIKKLDIVLPCSNED